MEEITEQLVSHKQSIENTAESTSNIRQQIAELQDTLAKLERRRDTETEECEELEESYEVEKGKLGMIEKTLKTIDQSCDRIRLMVENISPDFNIDQFLWYEFIVVENILPDININRSQFSQTVWLTFDYL